MTDLKTLFEKLPNPNDRIGNNRFISVPVPGYPHFHLARDTFGNPSLLVSIIESHSKSPLPSIVLEHISVHFNVLCTVTKNDGQSAEGIFTVLKCTGHDRVLHTYFLSIVRVLFDLIPTQPTQGQLSEAVRSLIELFRSITLSPKKSIQGLWAELLVIDASIHPEILVAAWHRTPQDRYDFNLGPDRLEVKSTSLKVRQHHFTLEQLSPIVDSQILVASIFTEQVGQGITVMELVASVREKIRAFPDLVTHLDRIVITTLGDKWRSAFDDSFDKPLALSTLQFYDARSIPCIPLPIPAAISKVHFAVDLSACKPINVSSIAKSSKLFAALKR